MPYVSSGLWIQHPISSRKPRIASAKMVQMIAVLVRRLCGVAGWKGLARGKTPSTHQESSSWGRSRDPRTLSSPMDGKSRPQ
jgi:hypothetical protein